MDFIEGLVGTEADIEAKFQHCRSRAEAHAVANRLVDQLADGVFAWFNKSADATGMDPAARETAFREYRAKIEQGRAQFLAHIDTIGQWPTPSVH